MVTQEDNPKTAVNHLKAFIEELEALNKSGKHLDPNGYALLKPNAEYLIYVLEGGNP